MERAFAIFGPPGTGKSHEILDRVKARLHYGTSAKKICLLSFTRAAAEELAERAGLRGAQISTIHALAFKVLGLSRQQVLGTDDLREISRLTGCRMTLKSIDNSTDLGEGDFYMANYNLARAIRHNPQLAWDNSLSDPRCNAARYRRFIDTYDKYKIANGLMDFGDMLNRAAEHMSPAYDCVFIDEAQDLSPAQWHLIESWLPQWKEVHIAGDDDQAIYKWGGADPHGMADFAERHGAEVTILQKSHRIPKSVHLVANRLVHNIKRRVAKKYEPRKETGKVYTVTMAQAIGSVKHGVDTLFLYRNHAMRYEICKHLDARRIPYVIDGGVSPLTSALGKAAAIWNRCVRQEGGVLTAGQMSVLRQMARPELLHDLKKKKIPTHKRWQDVLLFDKDVTPYLLHVEQKYGLDVEPTIHLSTIHGSKGREADDVYVMDAISKRVYESMIKDADSEIRTFYVAVTRARKNLYICKSADFKHRPTGLL